MKRRITRQFIEREVLRINGTKDLGRTERVGAVMLAALVKGPCADPVARFLHYPRRFVHQTLRRMQAEGMICCGKVREDWFAQRTGDIAFLCDLLCVEGLLKRVTRP